MLTKLKDTTMADKYVSTAKVIDGILILSLPDAVSPVVWQMELGQSKSSALEIRETDNDQFVLTLKTPRQDVLDIATYANRDLAIKALLVTSAALEKGRGQLKASPAAGANAYPLPVVTQSKSTSGVLAVLKKTFVGLAIVAGSLILLGVVIFLIFSAVNIVMSANSTPSAGVSGGAVSADEFLENR